MLYAILCYNEEDVVWSWSKERTRPSWRASASSRTG